MRPPSEASGVVAVSVAVSGSDTDRSALGGGVAGLLADRSTAPPVFAARCTSRCRGVGGMLEDSCVRGGGMDCLLRHRVSTLGEVARLKWHQASRAVQFCGALWFK